MSRKAMPTDEMGHPPSSADAPPPLTSGEIELLPCAHCGEELIYWRHQSHQGAEWVPMWRHPDKSAGICCLYPVRIFARDIPGWNRRTPPSTAGWVLVPIEPTATQVDAMHSAIGGTGDIGRHYIRILYRSAVNSAPSQEGEGRLRDVDEQTDHELRAGELWD